MDLVHIEIQTPIDLNIEFQVDEIEMVNDLVLKRVQE